MLHVYELESRLTPALVSWLPPSTAGFSEAFETRLTYGDNIGLAVRPDRVAVGFADPTDEIVAALQAKGGPLEGLTLVRWLQGRTAAVFEGASVVAPHPAITFTVPVFINKGGGRDAIALDEMIVAVDNEAVLRGMTYRRLDGTTDQFVVTLPVRGTEAVRYANEFRSRPGVQWAEPNFYQDWQQQFQPNDPHFFSADGPLWHLTNPGYGLVDADIDATEAWDLTAGGTPNRLFSIVDDGMELTHPDLNPWVNPGEIAGNNIDDDGNGYIDDINGWNFVSNNNNAGVTSNFDRHGTAVAGLATARGNNGIGVSGVSYNAAAMSVRIFENGGSVGSDATLASALYYAAGRNKSGVGTFASVSVMNNSWGGGGPVTVVTQAMTWATNQGRGGLGTVVFAASGNDYESAVIYPASLSRTNAGLISVGGSSNFDNHVSYANYGSDLDLAAPTGEFGALWLDTTDRLGGPGYNGTDYTGSGPGAFGGTSGATPIAAGVGGLILSQAENKGISLTAADVKKLLRNSTDLIAAANYPTDTGLSLENGQGRINAFSGVDGVGKPEISVLSTTTDLTSGAAINMGSAIVGASATQTFRIRNSGTSDLVISSLVATGSGFSIDAGPGLNTLKIGQTTTFRVSFAPTGVGATSGVVTLASNDASEGSFVLNLTASGIVGNVTGRTFEDWNGDGVRDGNDPVLTGRTVYLDANANGQLDRVSFTNTVNASIPDNNASGLVNAISVSGQTLPVRNARVTLNVTHPYTGDLSFLLISPAGTRVLLASTVGDDGDNFTGTIFDDSASLAIRTSTAPYAGSYKPQLGRMSDFDGQSANGNWTLVSIDNYSGDIGTLDNWSISFENEQATLSDSAGRFGFNSVANGAYTLRESLPSGWTATGSQPFTITSTSDNFADRDIGSGKNNRAYVRVFNDANGNGAIDPGDAGLGNRTVYRDSNDNGSNDSEPTVTTLASGNTFFDLTPGNHRLRLTPASGLTFTTPVDGSRLITAADTPIFNTTFGSRDTVAPTVLPLVFPSNQRSVVTTVRVDFSEKVLFTGNVADAFTLGAPFTASVDDSGATTRVTLTFNSPGLADGKYTLSVNPALVTDLVLNPLAANSQTFHRMFGDRNGDATVDANDFAFFGITFGHTSGDAVYDSSFDNDGDHTISSGDFAEFGVRFGKTLA